MRGAIHHETGASRNAQATGLTWSHVQALARDAFTLYVDEVDRLALRWAFDVGPDRLVAYTS